MLQSYVHHIHKRYRDLTESVLYTLRILRDEIEKKAAENGCLLYIKAGYVIHTPGFLLHLLREPSYCFEIRLR